MSFVIYKNNISTEDCFIKQKESNFKATKTSCLLNRLDLINKIYNLFYEDEDFFLAKHECTKSIK